MESLRNKSPSDVILDSGVAELYGVETKEVNQAVKKSPKKFQAGYTETNRDEKM